MDREQKLKFLKSLSVFSVPARYPEAFGLYAIEAMASGDPCRFAIRGSFPEIINTTQGGCVYDATKSGALLDALESLLDDPTKAREMGLLGHHAVAQNYANEKLASRLVEEIISPSQHANI